MYTRPLFGDKYLQTFMNEERRLFQLNHFVQLLIAKHKLTKKCISIPALKQRTIFLLAADVF